MATRSNASMNRPQNKGEPPRFEQPQGRGDPFAYCTDAVKLNAQLLEQGLRIMGAPLSGSSASKNNPLNGLSLTLKLIEQYQSVMFAQLESMAELQSQLWRAVFEQTNVMKAGNKKTESEKASDKRTQ